MNHMVPQFIGYVNKLQPLFRVDYKITHFQSTPTSSSTHDDDDHWTSLLLEVGLQH